jgi:N-formylglutamate deformylase
MNEMQSKLWAEARGDGPLMATAVHAGHEVRHELLPLMALDDTDRVREEDPYTDYWVKVVPTWLVPRRSRFEVDLNRPRASSVYMHPEMSWDLNVFVREPSSKELETSYAEYDAFYAELDAILSELKAHYDRFVVFDLHAYNFRRGGPRAEPSDSTLNPEVNVGTGTLNRRLFGPLVERFMDDLHAFDFLGRHLDVRENIKFKGRELARRVHARYGDSAAVLSLEFRKFFMDEWTGIGDVEQIEAIRQALAATLPGVLEELGKLKT